MSREPELARQTVLVIGGSSGIGLETARRARREGAEVILTGRDPERVHHAGLELGASIAAFDATDFQRLGRLFGELPTPIDHVLVTGPGPREAPLADYDIEVARRALDAHLMLPLRVAREAASRFVNRERCSSRGASMATRPRGPRSPPRSRPRSPP